MQKTKVCYEYILSIGSNSDNAPQHISEAFHLLKQEFGAFAFSSIISTRALDMNMDCVFFNAVAQIKTSIDPVHLKIFLKEIEKKMGRVAYSNIVLIDLDIILINGNVVHKDYENRKFIRELIDTIK